MEISLETIQQLAPDQASITAAKKLLKPAKWPVLGQSNENNIIWGECQGSGSKPYYTVADVVEHGYKCTCPSRKFPCKHVLALFWQFSDSSDLFSETELPQWVIEWLGRTKRTPASPKSSDNTILPQKDVYAVEPQAKTLSSEEVAKKEAAQAKRAASNKAKTDASISDGLLEFQQWLDDQLLNGISTFIKEINERCRRIAARLVDAKATNFAAQVDELPAKILPLPAASQPDKVFQELGKLALLSEAWFTDCDDKDIRRIIATSETREQVLADPASLKITGIWQTVGERIQSRKSGLIAHEKWLVNLDDPQTPPALLLDFYPAASGYNRPVHSVGCQLEGEVIFYPAKIPMRALLGQFQTVRNQRVATQSNSQSYIETYQAHLNISPWIAQFPVNLGKGKVLQDNQHRYWWSSLQQELIIALKNKEINPVILGSELEQAFIISDGTEADLLSVTTKDWGVIAC